MEDTVNITAEEAADRIRHSGMLNEAHQLSPADRHRANFAGRVCEILGMTPTVENFALVTHVMEELHIEPHEGHEYPKWVKTGRKVKVYDISSDAWVDGPKDEEIIVHDADEEAHAGDVLDVTDPVNPAPEPRTDTPTEGLIPHKPSPLTAMAPAGFTSAGQGKLVGEQPKDEANKSADESADGSKAPPQAPQRRKS